MSAEFATVFWTDEQLHYDRLRQRRDWLTARIAAKVSVKWDVTYDTQERDALSWALQTLPNPFRT